MKILIAGDFCPRDRVAELFIKRDYESVLSDVHNIIDSHDYSIVNEECPVVENFARPITKFCSNLFFTREGMEALKYAGFDCLTLANNHFRDYGDEGVRQTIAMADKMGFDYVGGGMNLHEAQRVLYRQVNGVKIAIVNFCEHEFSIATEHSAGSAPLDLPDNYMQICEAHQNAEFVIVIIHGGHEHYQLPSPRMKKTYRIFIDWGADIVVNHHQHCFSGYETYKGKTIFYGLGNFCFDSPTSRKTIWNEGLLLSLNIDKNSEYSFELLPYSQCDNAPIVKLLSGKEKERVFRDIYEINHIIADSERLNSEFDKYSQRRFEEMRLCLSPYSSRIGKGLCRRGIVPSFNTIKRIVKTRNFVQCESHRDVFNNYLDYIYQEHESH